MTDLNFTIASLEVFSEAIKIASNVSLYHMDEDNKDAYSFGISVEKGRLVEISKPSKLEVDTRVQAVSI
jgi:hypothetical protein